MYRTSLRVLFACGLVLLAACGDDTDPCGNGVIDPGEVCDDGNRAPYDGETDFCPADCTCDSVLPAPNPEAGSLALTYTDARVGTDVGVAVVDAGQPFAVTVNTTAGAAGCPTCVVALVFDLFEPTQGQQACRMMFEGMSQTLTLNFTAPATAGIYWVRHSEHWDFCIHPYDLSGLDHDRDLMAICVPAP